MTVAGITGRMQLINPYCLEPPLAPSVAAELTGTVIDLSVISRAYRELCKIHDLMLVEGAGGIMVPVIGRFLIADLIKMLDLPAIIVARPGLGTVNHTLLTVEYAKSRGIHVAGIIINGLKESEAGPAEKTNPGLIAELSGVPVMGIIPFDDGVGVDKGKPGRIIELGSITLCASSISSSISINSFSQREIKQVPPLPPGCLHSGLKSFGPTEKERSATLFHGHPPPVTYLAFGYSLPPCSLPR